MACPRGPLERIVGWQHRDTYLVGRWGETRASSRLTNSGCMYVNLSGTSRHMTRLPLRCLRNPWASLARCERSMMKIASAYSRSSALTGTSASCLSPAEAVSTPGHDAKMCSAV